MSGIGAGSKFGFKGRATMQGPSGTALNESLNLSPI